MYDLSAKWFPLADSETQAMSVAAKGSGAINFTTMARRAEQEDHFRNHGVLSQELNPFRYVQGLKSTDPKDLVVMYVKERSHWQSKHRWKPEKKWVVMGPRTDGHWGYKGGWLDTPEFKRRLKKTLTFLEQNQRPYWQQTVKDHQAFLDALKE